jgi:hypothetical protein
MAAQDVKTEPDGYFNAYMEYNKALRNWLVGFGIGGPVLILSNVEISRRVLSCTNRSFIFWTFALGVFVQIIVASLNKYINWCEYDRLTPEKGKTSNNHEFIKKFADKIWIDVLADFISIFSFILAAILFGDCVLG